jgi:RND family efflux transporter MFP subunit
LRFFNAFRPNHIPTMNQSKLFHALIGIAAIMLTGWLLLQWWPSNESKESLDALTSGQQTPPEASTHIHLTAAKAAVAGIRSEPVIRRKLELTRIVPARFAYDNRQHVAVRSPAEGVIDNLLVKPGDLVQAGQTLAILRSPTIGRARSEVLRRQADLDLLEARRSQMASIHSGVADLVASLRAGNSPEVVQRQLSDSTLGQYRGQLLANYSKMQLASQLADAATRSGGAISGRIVQERVSEQQQSRAELEGAVEQAIFETEQALQSAASDVDAARRNRSIALQELGMLLGVQAEQSSALTISPNETALTRLEIQSPINGTVERTNYSATERVTGGDELFIVADTSRLWVEADIRGQDWDAMNVSPGHPLTVTTPAEPDCVMKATVYFVGREVDPMTGAIPLVAEISNESGKLRPGLFARVEIPVESIENVLVVPRTAVVDVQGESSVFMVEEDGFRPIAVQTGAATSKLIEIRSGLEQGQQVVAEGAFLLKSELLLEGEE